MLRKICVLLTLAAAATAVEAAAPTVTIKKCQDAAGKWHYGDSAASACANSPIVEMSETGVPRKVVPRPLTADELKASEQQKDDDSKAVDQAKKDELLLSSYAHEADIVYVRDRKIAQLDASISASQDTLKSLRAALARLETQATEEKRGGKPASEQSTKGLAQTQAQIAKHEAAIVTKQQEKELVREQSAKEVERYRQLKNAGGKLTK